MKYRTTPEIEIAVFRYFDRYSALIVPNISWGLNIHECDVLCMTSAGYLTEVEIKISASDLKADCKKSHGHRSNKIKNLYFAIPSKLAKYICEIPIRAGILIITTEGRVVKIAEPVQNKKARALTDKEKYTFARLGAIRIWSLKNKIQNQKESILSLKNRLAVNENKKNKF